MPNVRDHLDENYSYVKGHVRRKRRGKNADSSVFLARFFFFIFIGAILIWILNNYWIWITIGIVLILALYILFNWKRIKYKILKSRVEKREAKAELDESIRYYEEKLKNKK